MPAAISAIVVAFRSAAHLPGVLADLDEQGTEEIIVVDNASPDDDAAIASAVLPTVRVVRLSTNRGFAAGVNAGVREATGDALLLINPDVRLDPSAVAALREAHARRPDAVLGPVVRDEDGRLLPTRRSSPHLRGLLGEEVLIPERASSGGWPQRWWSRWGGYDEEVEGPILSGVCLLIPRGVWDATGRFDEGYFLYWEEVDWQLRARAVGYASWLVPGARIVHARSASLGLHDPQRASLMGAATRRFLRMHLRQPRRSAALLILSLGQLVRWVLWALLAVARSDEEARARRRQHGAWLRGAWRGRGW